MATSEQFVQQALKQSGDRYVFAAEANPLDPDPDEFDCSELVQWAGDRLGLGIPDGSQNQYNWSLRVSVAQAVRTRGALLFEGAPRGVHHVAISLGDGTTIEARGSRWGVGTWGTYGRPFNGAGLVRNMTYVAAGSPPPVNQGGGVQITPNSSGAAVTFLQAMLNILREHKYNTEAHDIRTDGRYGDQTKAAVAEFQHDWESVHAFHQLINIDIAKNGGLADVDTCRAIAIAIKLLG